MSEATPVNITIRGKALRVRSTQSHDALQSIADYVEATMQRVERGTWRARSSSRAISRFPRTTGDCAI